MKGDPALTAATGNGNYGTTFPAWTTDVAQKRPKITHHIRENPENPSVTQ